MAEIDQSLAARFDLFWLVLRVDILDVEPILGGIAKDALRRFKLPVRTCPGTTPCFGAMGKHGLGSERKDWVFYEH